MKRASRLALAAAAAGPGAARVLSRQRPVEVVVEAGRADGRHAPSRAGRASRPGGCTGRCRATTAATRTASPPTGSPRGSSPASSRSPGRATGARRRWPGSRARSAKSRSTPGTPPGGGSCPWPPGASPTRAAASSRPTAGCAPSTGRRARSPSGGARRRPVQGRPPPPGRKSGDGPAAPAEAGLSRQGRTLQQRPCPGRGRPGAPRAQGFITATRHEETAPWSSGRSTGRGTTSTSPS